MATGVRGAVVLSSGFAEAGPEGKRRQAELERLATDHGLSSAGRTATASSISDWARRPSAPIMAELLRPGAVGVVSQSGGFSHAIAEYLMQQRCVGLSYIVSCGNQAGLTVEDYVAYLVDDDDTHVVGALRRGLQEAGDTFRQAAARARALGKPIVVLKVGRSENARQAMLAHTGSLAGTAEIVEAMLKQSGVVQVSSLNEMIDTLALLPRRAAIRAATLARRDPERARRRVRAGVPTPPIAPGSSCRRCRRPRSRRMKSFMPDFANPRNPLDGTGAMYEDARLFPQLFDVMLREEAIDVVAVNLRVNVPKPGGGAPSRQFSRAMIEALPRNPDRLVLAFSSFAGGDLDQEVVGALADAGVPFLESTETAMLALRHAREHRRFLDRPDLPHSSPAAPRASARLSGTLGNADAMQLLRDFGMPLAETVAVKDAEAAVAAADRLGYPVVLKIDSPDIAHKTDVGGVRVGCGDCAAVRAALQGDARRGSAAGAQRADRRRAGAAHDRRRAEMILGVKTDPLFGPAVVCGFGGIFVEQLRDVSLRVPPIGPRRRGGDDRRAAGRRDPVGRARPPAGRHAWAGRRDRQALRVGRCAPAFAARAWTSIRSSCSTTGTVSWRWTG